MKNTLNYTLGLLLASSAFMAFFIFLALYCIITGINTELAFRGFVIATGCTLFFLILNIIVIKR